MIQKHIKCEKCKLFKATQIHHIDKNRKNNLNSNLMKLCRKCHQKIHHNKIRVGYGVRFKNKKKCIRCGKIKSVKYNIGENECFCYDCHRKLLRRKE